MIKYFATETLHPVVKMCASQLVNQELNFIWEKIIAFGNNIATGKDVSPLLQGGSGY